MLAGTIGRPISRLVRFSEQIGTGNFNTEAPKNIGGELQVLRDALIRMKNDLSQIHMEREKMLAQVAHEIRNPLGGIELLTGLIKEDLDSKSKNSVYASKILEEIYALKNQINAYLSFSRPIEAHLEKVPLISVMEKLKRDFNKQLSNRKIVINISINVDFIMFDPNHLRQVLDNLMANSIQVLNNEGNISIISDEKGGQTYISISDDGPGIAEESFERIFDPFFTTHEQGTGLGLSICKKICQENKANLLVHNNIEKGCTFTILKTG